MLSLSEVDISLKFSLAEMIVLGLEQDQHRSIQELTSTFCTKV